MIDEKLYIAPEVLECSIHGSKQCKQPHLRKNFRPKRGIPISNVVCDGATYKLAVNVINEERLAVLQRYEPFPESVPSISG